MKKSTFHLRWVFGRLNLVTPHEQIEGITSKYPSLDWVVESYHIYAWVRYKGGWTQVNWMNKMDIWGSRTSKKKRTNPWFSKTPGFQKCRDEIESMMGKHDTPDFVDEVKPNDSAFEPQTIEEVKDHYGEDSPQFEAMSLARSLVQGLSHIGDRYEKLIGWLGWIDNTSEQENKTYDLLIMSLRNKWINEDLFNWISAHNFILMSFILAIRKNQSTKPIVEQPIIEQPKEEDPRPEQNETTCIIDGENLETLYYVSCKVDGCRLPLLGRVLSEDGDQILVWLIAPVHGEDMFWLKKSLCKVIKDDLESQKGNISKEQINDSISRLVGEK